MLACSPDVACIICPLNRLLGLIKDALLWVDYSIKNRGSLDFFFSLFEQYILHHVYLFVKSAPIMFQTMQVGGK